jgi:N-acyl homoserine lactone hydrolase
MAIKSMQVLYLGSSYWDKGKFTYRVDDGKMVENSFLSYLIRSDEGNILVDTGWHPDDMAQRISTGFKSNVVTEDYLPNRLKEVGLSMEDINMVVMTHLHLDHAGWLTDLKHAEVVVQKDEYKLAMDPPPFARISYPIERYNSPEIKWRLVTGDNILMPGLTLLFTPGHTPGCQSIMVDLPESGTILLSGDVGFLQENFEKEIIPGIFFDPWQALFSIKRLKILSQLKGAPIFTTHDIEFWRQRMIKPPEAYT